MIGPRAVAIITIAIRPHVANMANARSEFLAMPR